MILLQTASFLTLFHKSMRSRGKVSDFRIDQLAPLPDATADDLGLDAVFSDVSTNKRRAAQRVLSYLQANKSPAALLNEARLLMFFKGSGSHDYKFGSAVLEDYYQISPAWRDRYLAAAVYNLRGSKDTQNALVERTQKVLGG